MISMTRKPRIVDTYIGDKLREVRKMNGMTCLDLGRLLKISGPMVTKHETSQNRMPVSRLETICKIFKKPVTYFLPPDFGQ